MRSPMLLFFAAGAEDLTRGWLEELPFSARD